MRISCLVLNLANCSSDWCQEHCSTQLETCLVDCSGDQEKRLIPNESWIMTHLKNVHGNFIMSLDQDCIRDCNRDFPICESDCDLNQFLILGRTDFPTYEANGVTDEIIEFKNFQYHHHEVDMERGRKYSFCTIVQQQRSSIFFSDHRSTLSLRTVQDLLWSFWTQNKPVLLNFKISSGFLADFITKIVFPQ